MTPNFNVGGRYLPPDSQPEGCPEGCMRVGNEFADIHIPIELHPDTCIGKIETECCGEPNVVCEPELCGDGCRIVVTQRIRIRIPIRFDVCAMAGESTLTCACGPDGEDGEANEHAD